MTTEDSADLVNEVSHIKSGPVLSLDQLASKPARDLYDWWQANRQLDPLTQAMTVPPLRSTFDILDHPGIATHLFLIKRVEPGQYDFRILGEDTRFVMGSRATMNKRVELFVPGFAKSVQDYLDYVCDQGVPQQTQGLRLWPNHQPTPFEGLDCPLVDPDGGISHIIGTVCNMTADTQL